MCDTRRMRLGQIGNLLSAQRFMFTCGAIEPTPTGQKMSGTRRVPPSDATVKQGLPWPRLVQHGVGQPSARGFKRRFSAHPMQAPHIS